MVVPLSDWFWCGQPPLRPVHLLWRLKRVCSVAAPVFHSTLTLVWVSLQYRVDSRSLSPGSAFGLRQPSRQATELSFAPLRRRPDYTPGLAVTVALHTCALGLGVVAISAPPASSMPAPLAVVFHFIHTRQHLWAQCPSH